MLHIDYDNTYPYVSVRINMQEGFYIPSSIAKNGGEKDGRKERGSCGVCRGTS